MFNGGVVVLRDMCSDVGTNVGGALVLVKNEEHITTKIPLLTS